MIFENRCSVLFLALDSCAFKAIFGYHDKNRLGRADENQNIHVHCLLGLRHMTTYESVKPATAGPVADTYLELKMLCLFYFALESEIMAIMSAKLWLYVMILLPRTTDNSTYFAQSLEIQGIESRL